ncbi:MAG: hypothetical protein KDB90_09780 [Planctomycetes bacterium]|nr:hypothetical protein [Planctomycetota bacterium]
MNYYEQQPYGHVPAPPPPSGSALAGFLIVIGCHAIWIFSPYLYLLIGVLQLVYVIPTVIILLAMRRNRMAAGAGIAAGVTLLANGIICGGMIATS